MLHFLQHVLRFLHRHLLFFDTTYEFFYNAQCILIPGSINIPAAISIMQRGTAPFPAHTQAHWLSAA